MIKAVIFDVDGVMLDSEPYFAAGRRHILDKNGLVAPVGGSVNGSGMLAFWRSVLAHNGRLDLDAVALSRENFDYCLDGILSARLPATDGLVRLLGALEPECALAVGSSSDRNYVETVLKYLGIYDYFGVIVCGDDVENAKPHPDIYLKALELLRFPAADCYVIEDSDNGARAAAGAGIPCLGLSIVNPPTQSFADCARVFGSLAEIERHILGG